MSWWCLMKAVAPHAVRPPRLRGRVREFLCAGHIAVKYVGSSEYGRASIYRYLFAVGLFFGSEQTVFVTNLHVISTRTSSNYPDDARRAAVDRIGLEPRPARAHGQPRQCAYGDRHASVHVQVFF